MSEGRRWRGGFLAEPDYGYEPEWRRSPTLRRLDVLLRLAAGFGLVVAFADDYRLVLPYAVVFVGLVGAAILFSAAGKRAVGRAWTNARARSVWWTIERLAPTSCAALADRTRVRVRGHVVGDAARDGFEIRDGGGAVWVSSREPRSTGYGEAAIPNDGAVVECAGYVDRDGGPTRAGPYRDAGAMPCLRASRRAPIYLRVLTPAATHREPARARVVTWPM